MVMLDSYVRDPERVGLRSERRLVPGDAKDSEGEGLNSARETCLIVCWKCPYKKKKRGTPFVTSLSRRVSVRSTKLVKISAVD